MSMIDNGPTIDLIEGTTHLIDHARVKLAIHVLRVVEGGPMLLVLHGLGRSAEREVPSDAADWPGSVCTLDFTGHGESGIPAGGGYTCEILMGDADAALTAIGPSTILGRGLGGYIALLITGARPSLVRGVIIADGPGLAGGRGPSGQPAPRRAQQRCRAGPHHARSVRPARAVDRCAAAGLCRQLRPLGRAVVAA